MAFIKKQTKKTYVVYVCSFDRKTIIVYTWDQLQRERHLFEESVLFLPNSCNNFTTISPVSFILLPTCNLCVKKIVVVNLNLLFI